MKDLPFVVEQVSWQAARQDLKAVRHPVFVIEQKVPAELEWNEGDDRCEHVVARDASGRPIGTGRVDATGKIGRMAVLPECRGQGVASSLMEALLAIARHNGVSQPWLNAQLSALSFYEAHGFEAEGPVFLEAGIEHRKMRLSLRDANS